MDIKRVEFIKSIGTAKDYKSSGCPEIAVAGRSNVGKSSFINMIGKNSKLARVSETPGKTRLINIFSFNDSFWLMDLPGYGYAKVSDAEKERFAELIEGYFGLTDRLKNVFLLLDIRHEPSENDRQMLKWLYTYSIPFTIIATKTDKLPKSQINKHIDMLVSACGITRNMIIVTSARTGQGREEVYRKIDVILT